MFVVPVVALPFVHGWARVFAVIAVCAAVDCGGWGGDRIRGIASLRADVSDWGADFRVDADAVDDCDAAAGRDRVARDVLSAGGVEARGGVAISKGIAERGRSRSLELRPAPAKNAGKRKRAGLRSG